uniref:Uncharacterized protein n=1 Tax=Romanomermis culicivorax TaxID=13658 RepID=A0A915ILM1_ROMCU
MTKSLAQLRNHQSFTELGGELINKVTAISYDKTTNQNERRKYWTTKVIDGDGDD